MWRKKTIVHQALSRTYASLSETNKDFGHVPKSFINPKSLNMIELYGMQDPDLPESKNAPNYINF
jgi:hypothetical protein